MPYNTFLDDNINNQFCECGAPFTRRFCDNKSVSYHNNHLSHICDFDGKIKWGPALCLENENCKIHKEPILLNWPTD
jgi:hypothetical protein